MMTITGAAADTIRNALRRSGVGDPVVQLVEGSTETPPEVDQAIKRGASRGEISHIWRRASETMPIYLYPLVYPRSNFLWVFTTKIGGFRFASSLFYPRKARPALKRGVLDVAERGLVLKDADGTVVLPDPAARAL